MKWKLSIIAIINIATLALGIKFVLACADPGTPYDDLSFFQNNINAQPQFTPFYYTPYSNFYDDNWSFNNTEEDNLPDANIEEWFRLAKGTASHADIDSFMHGFSESDVKDLLDNRSGLSVRISGNSFSKFLQQSGNRKLLEYLLFAKKCEPLVAAMESSWDNTTNNYVTPVRNTKNLWPLIQAGSIAYAAATTDFLKWRYAFQVLRIAEYNRNYAATLELYDKLIGTKTAKNIMYPRCLSLKAGALFHVHKLKEAAYLYTRVFDLSNEMKKNAYVSFLWATDKIKIEQLESLCKTSHEKAVLAVMDGLYEKGGEDFEGLKLIEKAWALDPNVSGLNVLMTREINKAEQRYMLRNEQMEREISIMWDWLYEYRLKEKKEWKETKNKYAAYLNRLNLLSQKIAGDPKTADKAFWLLSSAYLSLMHDNFSDCKQELDRAAEAKMTTREHDVHDALNILYLVAANNTITPQVETELLPCMQWVERREVNNWRYGKVYWGLLNNILPDKYMKQRDTVKAVYCLARASRSNEGFSVSDDFTDEPGTMLENMSIDRLHELQGFVKKTDKTPFEKWLTDNTPYPVQVLKELEGTKYLREMKFDKAVATLTGLPKSTFSKTILPDVLISHLQDSQNWNASDSAKTYNKLQFARKMLELEQALDKEPKNSRHAYQYANGLYNMSYYGKAHHAFDYYRSTVDDLAYFKSPDRNKLPAYRKEYYSLSKALKYYLIAAENTEDAEAKARYFFMAAKCWQKNCPVTSKKKRYEFYNDSTYYNNALKNPYLAKIYSDYKNTSLYTAAFTSCSYLRDYVRHH